MLSINRQTVTDRDFPVDIESSIDCVAKGKVILLQEEVMERLA